jgi:hypothetical protein
VAVVIKISSFTNVYIRCLVSWFCSSSESYPLQPLFLHPEESITTIILSPIKQQYPSSPPPSDFIQEFAIFIFVLIFLLYWKHLHHLCQNDSTQTQPNNLNTSNQAKPGESLSHQHHKARDIHSDLGKFRETRSGDSLTRPSIRYESNA